MKKALLYSLDTDVRRGEESLSLVDTKSDLVSTTDASNT